ncbi:MATE family efflux transporter [Faecalicatena contorta]|uniref:MATE family efflux transporter n=1 Tax=Faecalicatena contorta TaxID=39482 RepID=UPI00195F8B2D|nr:MATE family efflux transporter [Faecalicatena contorta]MBM6685258.1 MATE family efflux transporter [Faecalicatena contorta]MBM6710803.1 MATE family efflux transporter [Faecalicatena contorta]HIX98957.1 MATE family efflux transporter [Candidatus Dorea intestinigallinarum]
MKENELEKDWMGTMKVSSAVAKMAIPSVISSLVTVLYNMADTFFVGQTGDALQVAAVSLTNPIFILFMAFANMFGMGGSAAASMALGQKNERRVRQVSSFVTYASLIVGVFFAVVLLVFTGPILSLFGADAQTYEYARGYTIYVAVGAPFIIWSAAASFVVRAEGASREAMIGSMIGTIANIVLDPLFIFGFGMGAAGAAIATTIGNVMASAYYLWYFLRKSVSMSLSPRDFNCGDGILKGVCSTGLPTAIFSALMSVSTIVLNQILVAYGNDPVAAIGIVFKANMFITFLQMGLANGVQPLLGYSYGAGSTARFREVESFTKKCCVVVGVAATVLFFVAREPIIRLFISDSDVVRYGVEMLVAYMVSGPFIGILFVNMNCMQSVEHALPATILSVMRQGVLLIPLLYLLQAVAGLNGVIYGQAITDYIAVLLSIIIWRKIRKSL